MIELPSLAHERRTRLPANPSEIEKMRFDYAWDWFSFHAEQRTKMFNYLLIGMGIFAAALVTAIDKKLALEAAVVSTAAALLAFIFWRIDHRNRELYKAALEVLIDAEEEVLFGAGEFTNLKGERKVFGVARRIGLEEECLRGQRRRAMWAGQHRLLMPLIVLGFAVLFAAAALRSWATYFGWIAKPNPGIELIVGAGLTNALDLQVKQPLDGSPNVAFGLLAAARFGPFAAGASTLDCKTHAADVEAIRKAVGAAHAGGQRALLVLVGATDRTPLAPDLQRQFGENAGLARARVSAVEGCLALPAGPEGPRETLRIVSGPAHTPAAGAASDPRAMEADRVVRVVVLGLPG